MRLVLTRPDDLHLHLRDGDSLKSVMPHTAQRFGRAIVMPNLNPPVTTTDAARAYRDRILAAVPHGLDFAPMMTLYLTDRTPPEEIARAKESGFVRAAKLYPAGATTHSDAGVTDVRKVEPTLRAMAELKMPLLVHGEVTEPAVDIFDREHEFLNRVLIPLLSRIPDLRVVLEHITTKEATAFVVGAGMHVAATITPHHLLMNRNAIFQGGIRPHHYCLPVFKREHHREALVEAAISGSFKFFLGTDSAPHGRRNKEAACGCAGIYSSHAGIELYAEVFEQAGALNRLDAFASRFGAEFYGLPRNKSTITLEKRPWIVPESYPFGEETIIPLRAGEQVAWRLAG